MPPKKRAEPAEPVVNVPKMKFDPVLAMDALYRAKALADSIGQTNLAIQGTAIKTSIIIPIEYAIETIKELTNGN